MTKENKTFSTRSVPTDAVLYAIERASDYLRADYQSGYASCDPVAECFAAIFDVLVNEVRDDDKIDERDRAAFGRNLKEALTQYFEERTDV